MKKCSISYLICCLIVVGVVLMYEDSDIIHLLLIVEQGDCC